MKTEVIFGILIGYVLWRWFSGQAILPSFAARDEEMDYDSLEFDDAPIYALN